MRLRFIIGSILLVFITSCKVNSPDKNLKVITFNLRYDNPRDSLNAWPNRIPLVCDFFGQENPDLIGLQEVLWHQYSVLDSALTDYSSVGVGRDDGKRGGEMNPLFYKKSRFELVRSSTFWLSDTPEVPGSKGWGASLPRIVTWVELADKKSNEHIFFFNTHFAHDSDSARMMSSGILLKEVTNIAGVIPFVITGDFNMVPSAKGYSVITESGAGDSLIQDSYLLSEEPPAGPTFTYNGFSEKPGEGRIDFIFVKRGTKVSGHKTFNIRGSGIYISDHWPVEATISFK
jgi:endonuclease/exonuclease/phosphatase family metal-dependent hydrolase